MPVAVAERPRPRRLRVVVEEDAEVAEVAERQQPRRLLTPADLLVR